MSRKATILGLALLTITGCNRRETTWPSLPEKIADMEYMTIDSFLEELPTIMEKYDAFAVGESHGVQAQTDLEVRIKEVVKAGITMQELTGGIPNANAQLVAQAGSDEVLAKIHEGHVYLSFTGNYHANSFFLEAYPHRKALRYLERIPSLRWNIGEKLKAKGLDVLTLQMIPMTTLTREEQDWFLSQINYASWVQECRWFEKRTEKILDKVQTGVIHHPEEDVYVLITEGRKDLALIALFKDAYPTQQRPYLYGDQWQKGTNSGESILLGTKDDNISIQN